MDRWIDGWDGGRIKSRFDLLTYHSKEANINWCAWVVSFYISESELLQSRDEHKTVNITIH